MRKIVFLINPKAGTRSKNNVPELVNDIFSSTTISIEFVETAYAGHAIKLAQEYANQDYDAVVAVGGDGTVNEVAQGLIGSSSILGILPFGSGNGLARHVGVPMDIKKAILFLKEAKSVVIDTGFLNEHLFLCTTGFGFDADVAHEFAKQKTRGFFTYSKIAMQRLFSYSPKEWAIRIGDEYFNFKAFIFTIANANQFGNNVFIAPQASLSDGLLDLCVLRKVSFTGIPLVLKDLFTRNINNNRFYTKRQFESLSIKNTGPIQAHVDGDPVIIKGDINVKILKRSIKIFSK